MGASTRTPAQVRDQIRTAFGAAWTAAGEDLGIVAWDNLDFDPSGLDAYVFASFAHSSGTIASLGAGSTVYNRRVAIFSAQINVRHNTGQARADELAEIVLDFLESLRIQGIRIRDVGMAELGRVVNFFSINVSAVVDYDSIRTV